MKTNKPKFKTELYNNIVGACISKRQFLHMERVRKTYGLSRSRFIRELIDAALFAGK